MGPVYFSTAQPQFPTRKLHGKKRRKWQACLSGAVFRRARKENLPAPMEDSPRGTHQGSDSCSWWQKWLTFATPSTPFWFLWCLFLYKEGNKRHVKKGKEKVYFMALLFFQKKRKTHFLPFLPLPNVYLSNRNIHNLLQWVDLWPQQMYFLSCTLVEQLLSNEHSAINKTDKYLPFPNYMWGGRKQTGWYSSRTIESQVTLQRALEAFVIGLATRLPSWLFIPYQKFQARLQKKWCLLVVQFYLTESDTNAEYSKHSVSFKKKINHVLLCQFYSTSDFSTLDP